MTTNNAAYQRWVTVRRSCVYDTWRLQTTLLTSDEWRSSAAVCMTLGGCTIHNIRGSQILVNNHDFCLPHSKPLSGSPRRNTAITFGNGVAMQRWKMFHDVITRFDSIHECDKQTTHNSIGHVYAQHRAAKVWKQKLTGIQYSLFFFPYALDSATPYAVGGRN